MSPTRAKHHTSAASALAGGIRTSHSALRTQHSALSSLSLTACLFFTLCYLLSTICSAAEPTTRPAPPDTVLLKELVELYEPVPFDHRAHAHMGEMSQGCTLCHHYSPESTTRPASDPHFSPIPACKSCHPATGVSADIDQPNLKGAYHRQCLNCHREWMQGNSCIVCHKPLDPKANQPPTAGDVVGRMRHPLAEPGLKNYRPRFTPADGGNVLFRHKEHVENFGIACAECHHRDSCSSCHDGRGGISGPKPMRRGETWAETHTPCINCHREDRCNHCHYKDDQSPPPPFSHKNTRQNLDRDHAIFACRECHLDGPKDKSSAPTCNAACHSSANDITVPKFRPGPQPEPPVAVAAAPPQPLPTTRPVIVRIRR